MLSEKQVLKIDAERRKKPWLHLDSFEHAAIWFTLKHLQESARCFLPAT